jgi:hypothetical protein
MKRLFRTAVGVIALVLLSQLANAQAQSVSAPRAAETPDLGSVSGSTYTNKYFGLTLTLPAGWSVQDSIVKKQLSEKGKELVTSDDAATKSELNQAVDNTLNLLTAFEHPPGTSEQNAMVICGAEKPAVGVKTDADYMLALKNTLKYAQVPITIEKEVYTEQIGGAAFSVIDFKTTYPGVVLNQKYYAHIVKDHVLFFIITYQTPEQLKTLQESLKSVTLH